MVQNKSLIFKSIPTGLPEEGTHLAVEDRGFDLEAPPPEGGVTVKNYFASLDPYMRARMRDPKIKSYVPAFEADKPIPSFQVAQVLKSDHASYKEGDMLITMAPIQEYSGLSAALLKTVEKLENPHNIDPKSFISSLGMPGRTAYSSLYEIGAPKKGETIFVSAASGAVGAIVGQLARHEGLKVIGSVGDDEKLDYIINELGFTSGFNYKKEEPKEALKRLAPEGIDIYYENVGGETLQAAFNLMNDFGRIIACGMISQYNLTPEKQMPLKNLTSIVTKRLKFQGFIQGDKDFGPKWNADLQRNVQAWIADGSFKDKMAVTKGMDNSIKGLLDIFAGKNFGKSVLEIAPYEK